MLNITYCNVCLCTREKIRHSNVVHVIEQVIKREWTGQDTPVAQNVIDRHIAYCHLAAAGETLKRRPTRLVLEGLI